MKYIIIFFLFIIGCSGLNSDRIQKVYICGDHECKNKKEMDDYFKNNISIEVYSIRKTSKNDKQYDLVELNMTKQDKIELVSIESQKKEMKEKLNKRKKLSNIEVKEGEKNLVNRKKKNKSKITLVRICKDLQECDINDVENLIFNRGSNKKFPNLAVE